VNRIKSIKAILQEWALDESPLAIIEEGQHQ
jgi:hypothetical protein